MKAVLQRVTRASVSIDGQVIGRIGSGLVILLGVAGNDDQKDAEYLANKSADLRLFADPEGKLNRSLLDIGGGALVVSQFTLLADTRKGRRPSFVAAAPPDKAAALVDCFVQALRNRGVPVETGRFQAHMLVEILNDGPVTIILDSAQSARRRKENAT
jgi:D-tyrosyl-tRNA(Tyr) deacylase